MSFATFKIAPPSNCYFANVSAFMHAAGTPPFILLGGLTGLNIAEASSAREFLMNCLEGHMRRVWEATPDWCTIQVSPATTATELTAAIQAFEPRQREGMLIGMSLPVTRVAHRADIQHAMFFGTGVYHYFLRCVHAADTITTVDATPTTKTPEPFILERTDKLDTLLGGDAYELYINRPSDILDGVRKRFPTDGELLSHARNALRADLRKRSEGAAPTLAWVAARWATSMDQDAGHFFAPHFNVFKVIAEHRAFLPDLVRAAVREEDTSRLIAEFSAIQELYTQLRTLCFKLHFTQTSHHRQKIIASGTRHLETLLDSERRWAVEVLRVLD